MKRRPHVVETGYRPYELMTGSMYPAERRAERLRKLGFAVITVECVVLIGLIALIWSHAHAA